ncbi:integrase core domain-containing protein [Jiella marina]
MRDRSDRSRVAASRSSHGRDLRADWALDFNTQRPHCSLGYLTPD